MSQGKAILHVFGETLNEENSPNYPINCMEMFSPCASGSLWSQDEEYFMQLIGHLINNIHLSIKFI